VFDLADGQSLPPEFKEGDEIIVVNRPDNPVNIAMGMNAGYYDVTHVLSGVTVGIKHETSGWRF
jgi:hypothetical protein